MIIRLKILEKGKYEYKLQDDEEHEYIINIEFLDIIEEPEIGDLIYINKELLDPKYEGYSTSYTFGSLESKYGKENISIDDIDVIKVVKGETTIYLKRLYG